MSDTASTTETETTTADEAALGDAGKRALQAERDARKTAEARATAAEARVTELESASTRAAVAAKHNLTEAQAARLSGSTEEELNADAEALLSAFTPPTAAEETPAASTFRQSPREALKPGAVPGTEVEPSVADVAAAVLRG